MRAFAAKVVQTIEAAVRWLDELLGPPRPGWESVRLKARRVTGLLGLECRLRYHVYRRRGLEGEWEVCYPLDGALGLARGKRLPPGVVEWAVELPTRHSVRVTAQMLAEAGIQVSAQTIHRRVQEVGAAWGAEQGHPVDAMEQTRGAAWRPGVGVALRGRLDWAVLWVARSQASTGGVTTKPHRRFTHTGLEKVLTYGKASGHPEAGARASPRCGNTRILG